MTTPYYHSPAASHWWSRSKSSSKLTKERPREPALSRTYSAVQADASITDRSTKQPSMFGNFTSAIRLKPKKTTLNTIAVHEPPKVPSPLIIPPSNSVEPYGPLTSRPFSKAVSAVTVTSEDSVGPKTPLDMRLSYQKSLVDADPFAASTGVMFSSPKDAPDLEQLFIPPDRQMTKDAPVSPRTSYRRPHTANSLLLRERLVSESTVPSPRPPTASRPALSIRTPQDVPIMRPNTRSRKVSTNDVPAPTPVISSPASASATYSRSKSKSSDGPRPHTRPRGMTDTSGLRPSLRKDAPPLTRQPSFSRSVVTPPETSPPSQALPPVPPLQYLSVSRGPDRSPTDPGSSSSSLSFASSTSEYELMSKGAPLEDRRLQSIRDQVKVVPEPRTKSPTRILRGALNPTLSRLSPTADDRLSSLKKMPSQPSLQSKFTGPPSGYPDDHPLGMDDVMGSPRSLKKQRSFHHHSRVPVPPLPHLRHANSFTPSEASASQSVDLSTDRESERQKEKRESAASLSKRRFLPGSIRRGSTSHAATFIFDDDTGSLIIPPSEFDRPDKSSPPRFSNPFGSPGVESMMLPATSTFYDDLAGSPPTASHFPQPVEAPPPDAGPRQILSAAQILKLEEMLENDESEVSSIPSSRTSPAELNSPKEPTPPLPPTFEEFGFGLGSPQRKASWTDSIVSASTIFSSTFSDKIIFSDKVETGSTLSFFDQQQNPGYRPRTTSGNLAPLETNFLSMRSQSPLVSSPQSALSMGIESTFGIEPNQPLGGLTPPPRLRPKPAASLRSSKSSGNRGSMIHIQPLSPPPLRRKPTSASASSRSTSSRSSSSRREAKLPPPAFKNESPVKGIMRKPSFLDIDDDPEVDMRLEAQIMVGGDPHQRNISMSSVDDSFLDLGRENNSFETIRTLSVEGSG